MIEFFSAGLENKWLVVLGEMYVTVKLYKNAKYNDHVVFWPKAKYDVVYHFQFA